MTYELLERIAILEREKAELEKELHASVVERHDAEHIADAYKTERDIQRERAQAMHRRAQRAESELASLTKRTAAEIRTLNALVEGVQQNELHWLLQFLHCARLADSAMTEGLKECERLRAELAELAERDARVEELKAESERHYRSSVDDKVNFVIARIRARAMHRRAQKAEGELARHGGSRRQLDQSLTSEIVRRVACERSLSLALSEGLKECERLRTLKSLAERSADNAFSMLAHAEMREEAAKKRAAVLTEALAAVEYVYAEPAHPDGNNSFSRLECSYCGAGEAEPHDRQCLVGRALGRIPAEVPNE